MIDNMLDTGPGRADGLPQALLDSRQRWRAFGTLAADLVFETDRDGRLTFVAPDPALGHASSDLLGRPASHLLAVAAGPLGCAMQMAARAACRCRSRRGWTMPDVSWARAASAWT